MGTAPAGKTSAGTVRQGASNSRLRAAVPHAAVPACATATPRSSAGGCAPASNRSFTA
jgi:hypothetical protein